MLSFRKPKLDSFDRLIVVDLWGRRGYCDSVGLRQESYFHSNKEEMKTPIKMEFAPMLLEVHGLGVQ